ncbi:MAG: glycosyltransferase family 39 protein [Alphaproteobacteria bacterium]|nr:glycosyltransferase family 39 protein [Alphaproteobacteria bacterium]
MAVLTSEPAVKPLLMMRLASQPRLFQQTDADTWWDRLALGIVLAAITLVLATFRDYGVTWDEDVHNWYGNFALDYYLSLFGDKTALHWRDLYNYGAAFDMVAAALNRASPIGVYETRHLLNGLVGILGLIGCWKLGRAMAGPRVGLVATLLLILTPNYYGQMFNNPKDIPFAVGMVWSTYYMVRIVPMLPRPDLATLAKLGTAIGMTMGVRIGGLLLIGYLGLLLVLDGVWRALAAKRIGVLVATVLSNFWRVFFPVAGVAYPVTLLFWPWAQTDPIENPLRALAFFSHQTFPFYTLFDGEFVPASDLPWTYLPTYIALALPEIVLVLLVCAPIAALVTLWRSSFRLPREDALKSSLLALGIVFPVAYAIAIRAVLFDGMRHFIFVLPLIAVAAAMVADRCIARLASFRYRRAIWGMLVLYGCAHISVMAMLHPDQYVYYNAFVGGVEGAQHKFKLDYWANSYAEAVQGLEDYLRSEYGADFEEHEFTVGVCGPPVSAGYFLLPNFRLVRDRALADFFIAFTKDNCERSLPGRPIYRVERMGALLSLVLDRRDLVAERRAARQASAMSAPRPTRGAAVPADSLSGPEQSAIE